MQLKQFCDSVTEDLKCSRCSCNLPWATVFWPCASLGPHTGFRNPFWGYSPRDSSQNTSATWVQQGWQHRDRTALSGPMGTAQFLTDHFSHPLRMGGWVILHASAQCHEEGPQNHQARWIFFPTIRFANRDGWEWAVTCDRYAPSQEHWGTG